MNRSILIRTRPRNLKPFSNGQRVVRWDGVRGWVGRPGSAGDSCHWDPAYIEWDDGDAAYYLPKEIAREGIRRAPGGKRAAWA